MIIGIDPGLTGAIALLGNAGQLRRVCDIPTVVIKKKTHIDVEALCDILYCMPYTAKDVYLENVHSMPMQGISSAFNFGHTFGILHGMAIGLGFRVHLVTPQTWKFNVGLGAVPGADMKARKTASRLLAQKHFPDHADSFKRAKDDGRAEAALIGLYGVKQQAAP